MGALLFFTLLSFSFSRCSQAATPAIVIGGAKISVEFENFSRVASDQEVLDFIHRSAEPVAAYYGKFPVKKLNLEVIPNSHGNKGLFGREFHGNRISFFLGGKTDPAKMKESGILTHEMFHLGFPDLKREYAWVEEGLATYLAHLSRARSGQTSELEFWTDMREGFEDSMPKDGDGGLADSDNYRRTYWGGALFWFEIDMETRERSAGKRSLDTITRSILAQGGSNAHRWNIPRLRRAVDQAAGIPVFQKWYDFFGPKPGKADLEALWAKLGISCQGKSLTLSNQEPFAAARKALLMNLP